MSNQALNAIPVSNTIIAGNTGGDLNGPITGANNLIGGDAKLSPLGDYGGPLPTIALLPGSPAIGGGAAGPGVPGTDERGFARAGRVDIGAFQSQGTDLVVNATDGGTGSGAGRLSLPQAVRLADAMGGAVSIDFDLNVFLQPTTIALTAGPLAITAGTAATITGFAANRLTIDGGGHGPVFAVYGGSATLSGMTITGGKADRGGGLWNDGGTVSLSDVTITGNTAAEGGGLATISGSATLTQCTISGNLATVTGGGLYCGSGGQIMSSYDTIRGNTATTSGGGVSVAAGGSASINSGTVAGNRTSGVGGGVYTTGGGTTGVELETISRQLGRRRRRPGGCRRDDIRVRQHDQRQLGHDRGRRGQHGRHDRPR